MLPPCGRHLIDKAHHEFRRCAVRAAGLAVVVHSVAADDIAVEVYSYDRVGAERTTYGNRHGIDQATIHEPAVRVAGLD